jgi:hypothetical protein
LFVPSLWGVTIGESRRPGRGAALPGLFLSNIAPLVRLRAKDRRDRRRDVVRSGPAHAENGPGARSDVPSAGCRCPSNYRGGIRRNTTVFRGPDHALPAVGRITATKGGMGNARTVPNALAPGYRHSGPRKGSHYTRRPSTQLPYYLRTRREVSRKPDRKPRKSS